jgi:hypothetical protein
LKNKFGFDDAFNYKEELDLDAALKRLAVQFVYTRPVVVKWNPTKNKLYTAVSC